MLGIVADKWLINRGNSSTLSRCRGLLAKREMMRTEAMKSMTSACCLKLSLQKTAAGEHSLGSNLQALSSNLKKGTCTNIIQASIPSSGGMEGLGRQHCEGGMQKVVFDKGSSAPVQGFRVQGSKPYEPYEPYEPHEPCKPYINRFGVYVVQREMSPLARRGLTQPQGFLTGYSSARISSLVVAPFGVSLPYLALNPKP